MASTIRRIEITELDKYYTTRYTFLEKNYMILYTHDKCQYWGTGGKVVLHFYIIPVMNILYTDTRTNVIHLNTTIHRTEIDELH